MSLVEKISELCESKGKTLTSLERECGFGVSSIRKWNNHAPTLPKLLKVAEVLEVTVGEILGEKNPVPTNEDRQKAEFIDLWAHLSPEQKKRELAYLRELVNEQDK